MSINWNQYSIKLKNWFIQISLLRFSSNDIVFSNIASIGAKLLAGKSFYTILIEKFTWVWMSQWTKSQCLDLHNTKNYS